MEDPGTRFRYSEATTVLGRLVEVWSGQKFDTFVTARILRPLGMTDTVVLGRARGAPAAGHRLSTGAGRAARARSRSKRCRSPNGRSCSKARSGWCRPCRTSCASARCCSTRASSAACGLISAKTAAAHDRERPAARGSASSAAARWAGASATSTSSSRRTRAAISRRGEYGWDGSAGTFFAIDPARETVVDPDDAERAGQPRRSAPEVQGRCAAGIGGLTE